MSVKKYIVEEVRFCGLERRTITVHDTLREANTAAAQKWLELSNSNLWNCFGNRISVGFVEDSEQFFSREALAMEGFFWTYYHHLGRIAEGFDSDKCISANDVYLEIPDGSIFRIFVELMTDESGNEILHIKDWEKTNPDRREALKAYTSMRDSLFPVDFFDPDKKIYSKGNEGLFNWIKENGSRHC